MHRRTLLKGLGAASLWTATRGIYGPVVAKSNAPVTLNVILHGLFAMQFTQQNMQLWTPYVSEHRYLASGWDPNKLSPLCPENKPFVLKGVPRLPAYDPHKLTRALVLSQKQQKFQIDPNHAYVSINLPWPKEIALLRFAKPSTGVASIFKPPLDGLKELSLCQALIYPGASLPALALTGTTWKPTLDPKYQTVNMHLWAEPDHDTSPQHAVEAYQRLGELLKGLNFELAGGDVTTGFDTATGVTGMPPDQEMGLSEWLRHQKSHQVEDKGTHGSDCGMVAVVD